ncbi:MAG: electron transfer flavoprotein subunit beta/FixA family protein [Candidatus Marinimicrobia bacterium]|nr:electron transfer flavoprotein subunit beta/FixA family protein [Candidatus Neomarinimicrobiota bacterium]
MRIIVPIKQVPETSNVKMDPKTGTMIREGVEQIINPLDLYAIEEGISLKENYSGEVIVVSMGPPKAEEAVREAIAMGCDDGILLTDKRFAGADTWATSYTIAQAVRKIGDFDMIICGERATDGDTGQVGPGIGAWLDIPFVTYVSSIKEVYNDKIIVERIIEEGYEILEVELPALLTVVKEINYPRLPTLRGKQKSKSIEIKMWGPEDIDADEKKIGLNGSPTRVVKISKPKIARNGQMVYVKDEDDINEAVDSFIEFLKSKEIL